MPTTPVEIDSSEARDQLPQILANVTTTPITVLRYGKPVADIVAHVSAAEREQAQRDVFAEAIALAELCDGSLEKMQALYDLGLRQRAEVEVLLGRLDGWKDVYGYELESGSSDLDWIAEKMPDVYHGNLEAIIAYVHLDPETAAPIHEAGGDVVAWSAAVATVERAARERKDTTTLLREFKYYEPEEGESGGAALMSTGLGPEEFTRRALQLISQGVAAQDVLGTFGDDAIPADVLALGRWAAGHVTDLRQAGLSMADACKLVRHYGISSETYGTLGTLIHFGVTDVDTLRQLVGGKVKTAIIRRAHEAGLTPQQWLPLLPMVGKYAYGADGWLPWDLLVSSAEQGISLTAWDKLPERPEAKKAKRSVSRFRSYDDLGKKYTPADAPFHLAYSGRIVELASHGITPTYLLTCWGLRSWIPGGEERFVDQVIDLRTRGLRLDVAKHLGHAAQGLSTEAGIFLLTLLADQGATLAEVEGLGELGSESAELFISWRANTGAVARFLGTLPEEQRALVDLAADLVKNMDGWRRRSFCTKIALEAADLLQKRPERLHSAHLGALMYAGGKDWVAKAEDKDGMLEIVRLFGEWREANAANISQGASQ